VPEVRPGVRCPTGEARITDGFELPARYVIHTVGPILGLFGDDVGRSIHEEPSVPNHFDPFQKDVLTEGLVLTIEPMISAGSAYPVQDADGWTIRTKDGSLSAHHEHTLVITKGTPIVLTGKAA
jgi:methionine aminopeptidase